MGLFWELKIHMGSFGKIFRSKEKYTGTNEITKQLESHKNIYATIKNCQKLMDLLTVMAYFLLLLIT